MNTRSDNQVVNWIYSFEEELGWTSPGADDNLSHQSSTTLHYIEVVAFCRNFIQLHQLPYVLIHKSINQWVSHPYLQAVLHIYTQLRINMQYSVTIPNTTLGVINTLRCQINESTRLAFFDFSPRLTRLFGPKYSFSFSTLLD